MKDEGGGEVFLSKQSTQYKKREVRRKRTASGTNY